MLKLMSMPYMAWCLHILCKAHNVGLKGIYEAGTIDLAFLRKLARLSTFDEGPKLAKERLAEHGIALVIVGHLPKTYLDGAALRAIDQMPVVGMMIRYGRLTLRDTSRLIGDVQR